MTEAIGILTSLLFGGIAYVLFGFWQGKQHIKNQINFMKEQRRQQQELKQRQKEWETAFMKKWESMEVKDVWISKK